MIGTGGSREPPVPAHCLTATHKSARKCEKREAGILGSLGSLVGHGRWVPLRSLGSLGSLGSLVGWDP